MANPPPPYDNITGISRAVMKDNAQETLANYNGNARPGELVVDLTQDPPPLYVGNNAGQLTVIGSGGGAGLPLANGSSNFNIAIVNGNATITVDGGDPWIFDTTGKLVIPGTITSDDDTTLTAQDDVNILGGNKVPGSASSEGGDINITGGTGRIDNGTSTGSGGDVSIAGGDGGDGINQGASSGGFVELLGGYGGAANNGNAIGAGSGGRVSIIGGDGGNNAGNISLSGQGGNVEIYGGSGSFDVANTVPSGDPGHVNLYGGNWGFVTPSGNIYLNTYDGSNFKTFTYDNNGNVTMAPGGGLNFVGSNPGIVQSPDEDFYIRVQDADDDGFSVYQEVDDGAGNVLGQTRLQRDRFQIGFTNGSSPTFNFTETGQTEIPGNIRTTDYADTSLYVVTDNNPSGSVELKAISYSGDVLGSNVRVTQNNATISTGNALYTWTFNNTGNLTLPLNGNIVGATANNNGYINWFGNSSGDGGGYTTMNIVPDNTRVGGDQYLIIDPTAPGHIHIRAGGTQDNSSAELYLGGENSYFKVASGPNPDVSISSNSRTWTYHYGALGFPVLQYANLTAIVGSRAFINNANLVAAGNFGAQVSGGGSNVVPVWSDGTNWYIG